MRQHFFRFDWKCGASSIIHQLTVRDEPVSYTHLTYGKLDFDKYMVQFASDRFVNFEIQTAQATGLKIPVSAVTTKNFYLVPQDYLTNGGKMCIRDSSYFRGKTADRQ